MKEMKVRSFKRAIVLILCLTLVLSTFVTLGTTQSHAADPAWTPNVNYAVGNIVTYNGGTYKCISAHTSNVAWDPVSTLNILWQKVGGDSTPSPTSTPTSTSTPTNTMKPSSPSGHKITGFINPDHTSSDANYKAGFTIEIIGSQLTTVTTSNGYFEVANIPNSTTGYTLKISKAGYLSRTIENIIVNADIQISTDIKPLDIWAGDANLDNVINMADVMEIAKVYNTVKGDGKYNENYDYNKDTAINLSDIMILIKHFNKAASEYPPVGDITTSTSTPTTSTSNTPTPTPSTSTSPSPTSATGDLKITYTTTTDSSSAFTGKIVVANPNTSYAWNGKSFVIWDFTFETTSDITSMTNPDGAINKTVNGDIVTVNIGYQSIIDLGKTIEITVQGTKKGSKEFPQNFKPHYVRAEDIIYPEYAGLPSSWSKNKADLKASDLITNASDYYNTTATAFDEKMIVYKPYHATQVWLGQPKKLSHMLNACNNIRIWIPNKYIAMGMAFDYEMFKFNPNYMCALGTKENFACGLVDGNAGISTNPVTLDGQQYYWPIVGGHPDGPFQQEAGNFNDCRGYIPDFLPETAFHDDYTKCSLSADDPMFATAAISSAVSLMITRETIWAVPGVNFTEFVNQATDPWAEYTIVDYAYNRGVNTIFDKQIFGSKRQEALNSTNMATTLGLDGFGDHVSQIRYAMDDMNKAVNDLYDAQITWDEMDKFFGQLRKFYANGVPSDTEWNAMKADVHKSFDVLATHWGGSSISYRYDFMTLMRVAKQYLPKPYNPRPTGATWYYLITNKKVT